jgi:hypothetical protein
MRQRPMSSVDYLPRARFNEAEAFSFNSADPIREIVVILNDHVVGLGDEFSVEDDLDHGFYFYLELFLDLLMSASNVN